jgi:hypothetical protein
VGAFSSSFLSVRPSGARFLGGWNTDLRIETRGTQRLESGPKQTRLIQPAALAGAVALEFAVGFALSDATGFGDALQGVFFVEALFAHERADFVGDGPG